MLFEPMSPAAFAPFDGTPGTCAIARDTDFRVVWCNQAFASELGRVSPDEVVGMALRDGLEPRQADERESMMRTILETGRMIAYQQVWKGVRWLTRVWPLDPEAFGHPGYFVVMQTLNDPIPTNDGESNAVRFIRSADLGELAVLTPRELEVYYYLASGMTVADIGKLLFRSEKTIGRHHEAIHRKLKYKNRAELVRDAVQRGIVHFTGKQWLSMTGQT